MAETHVNHDIDHEPVDSNPEDLDQNSSILAGLNLALILSSITLPSDDEDFQNSDEKEIKIREEKGRIKSNVVRKRNKAQVNEFRAEEKQMAKPNRGNPNKLKRDCRHARKM